MCRFVTPIILVIGSTILVREVASFVVPASGIATLRSNEVNNDNFPRRGAIFAEVSGDSSEDGDDATVTTALPPATHTSDDGATDKSNEIDTPPEAAPVATTALFINQQTKRILVEELGYRRAEVERLRPELAQPLVEKRTFRPPEMPEEWMMAEEDTTRAMLDKLESENRYPLKFPLLAVGTILFVTWMC